jgi:ATP-dependent Zn protease
MSTRDLAPGITTGHASVELAGQWRRLTRLATAVAIVTSPVPFVWLQRHNGWAWYWALAATVGIVIGFRGLVDLGFRRFIPWPSLFGTDDARLHEEDVVARRRSWFWRRIIWLAFLISLPVSIVFVIHLVAHGDISWVAAAGSVWHWIHRQATNPQTQGLLFSLPIFFLFNFLIFMGPMLLMGVSQIRGFEPGDANWGVKLDDVRGQVEAKEEVRRIVSLWQSGEAFEKAGGKRERGLLFFGAPGTGKTMLAKAIATGFNSPFVTIPGSGFAQTFIGIDAVIVRFLARKAKRLARKWGGQCIVFIDEIDAVGMRRQALGGARSMRPSTVPSFHDHCFYGPFGALNPSGDLILESRAWRERLFELREPPRAPAGWLARVSGIVNQGAFPGMFGGAGGGLALNQLLITMDGVDSPPFWRRFWTNRINQWLDASYIVPRRVGKVSLRMPPPKPLNAQIYFIGATNVPIENLDPALRRPGRMGRHVWFRTPTKDDRKDIFDLYLAKVQHEEDLDGDRKRDELARITSGYSPAMIEQVCSMALTYAHHDARERFGWNDLIEAMTTVESGTAIGIEYVPEETRAVAIHEAGHAVASHVYVPRAESTRLSIRMRAGALGHHMALEKEERFSQWEDEQMGDVVHGLGAMAAEHVFFGQNSTGVGGDIEGVTARAAYMVGTSGMGPERVDLGGKFDDETGEETRQRIMRRFERIGLQIMNRTAGGGPFEHNPIGSVLSDPSKRALAAQILGQAYVKAYHLIAENKEAVEKIAETLIDRKEIYGDELVALLNEQNLKKPEIDVTEEAAWPQTM